MGLVIKIVQCIYIIGHNVYDTAFSCAVFGCGEIIAIRGLMWFIYYIFDRAAFRALEDIDTAGIYEQ